MSTFVIVMVVAAVLAAPGAWAQPLEFESIELPSRNTRSPALKQRSPQARGDSGQGGQGQIYTYADGDRTVRVTTLGEEFLRGVEGACVVEDFPHLGQRVTLEWQQNQQNFVITEGP